MPKRCVETAFRQAMREVLSPRDRLRVVMRTTEILGAAESQMAREAWAKELPALLVV